MAGRGLLIRKISEMLTLEGVARKGGRRILEEDLGLLQKAAFVVKNGQIDWVGPDDRIPRAYVRESLREISMKGRTVLPGFVECHTHTVFAGDRSAEFELRQQGLSYQEIAARGGGILSSVRSTRETSVKRLTELAQKRADEFVRQGVTTLEIKSGYGLNLKDEMKSLRAAGGVRGPHIVRTFLGAHAVPPEFSSAMDYLKELSSQVLPEIRKKKLAERVDIFIEKGFFNADLAITYLEQAKSLGFEVTIHADQLTLCGGARAAVTVGAMSADHVIQIGSSEIQKLAKSEITAVLLPAADLYMNCSYPPARALIDAGARVALATDFNPGTSPTQDLTLVGLLARLQMKMSLPEVIAAYTYNAAAALGLAGQKGSLCVGQDADFISTDKNWRSLFYSVGERPLMDSYVSGKRIKAE